MSALPLRVPLHDAEKAAQAKPLTVAVTGGSGYVGSVLVKRLLVSGHTVHATVRDPSNERKVKHLTALPGAAERLKLFKADLLDKDTSAFEAAFAGCSIVLHTASPFSLTVKPSEVQDKLVRPAVSGVELALGAASKTASVETVVMTSSVVAVWGNSWEHGKDHVITEADWDASANEKWLPYSCSKTLAERRAWELEAAQTGPKRWRLATILPGFVMGPPVSLVPSESVDFCKSMLNGEFKMAFPPMGMAMVDVEDVAAAHILAALIPSAKGRYLCVSGTTDLHTLLKQTEPLLKPPRKVVGMKAPLALVWVLSKFGVMPWDTAASCYNKVPKVDNSKSVKELGIKYIPATQSLADMAEAIEKLRAEKKQT